jgi:hypothetical protein
VSVEDKLIADFAVLWFSSGLFFTILTLRDMNSWHKNSAIRRQIRRYFVWHDPFTYVVLFFLGPCIGPLAIIVWLTGDKEP